MRPLVALCHNVHCMGLFICLCLHCPEIDAMNLNEIKKKKSVCFLNDCISVLVKVIQAHVQNNFYVLLCFLSLFSFCQLKRRKTQRHRKWIKNIHAFPPPHFLKHVTNT